MTEDVQDQEESKVKYVTAILDKVEDAELIADYAKLRIAKFGPKDVLAQGVHVLLNSRDYRDAVTQLKKEL